MPDIFEVYDDRFYSIVSPESVLETVVDGFEFIEGAIWHPGKELVIFSDALCATVIFSSTPFKSSAIIINPVHFLYENPHLFLLKLL